MDNLGTLTTGAGVSTDFSQDYVHQYLIIGDSLSAPNIQGLTVTVGGSVTQRINFSGNTTIMEVVSQILAREAMGIIPAGSTLGFILPIGDGFNAGDKVLYTITNGAAASPAVRAYSTRRGARNYVRTGVEQLNANSSQLYTDFDYLVFDDGGFDYANIDFADGHSEGRMDEVAMASLLMTKGPLFDEVSAGNVIVVDNTDRTIAGITLIANANPIAVARIVGPV